MTGSTNIALLRSLPAQYESLTLPRGGLTDSSLPSARTVRKYTQYGAFFFFVIHFLLSILSKR